MRSSSFFPSTGLSSHQLVRIFFLLDYLSNSNLISLPDSTPTPFQPFFLNFYKVHALAMHFFLRMWSESGSASDDFGRIVALTRSQ